MEKLLNSWGINQRADFNFLDTPAGEKQKNQFGYSTVRLAGNPLRQYTVDPVLLKFAEDGGPMRVTADTILRPNEKQNALKGGMLNKTTPEEVLKTLADEWFVEGFGEALLDPKRKDQWPGIKSGKNISEYFTPEKIRELANTYAPDSYIQNFINKFNDLLSKVEKTHQYDPLQQMIALNQSILENNEEGFFKNSAVKTDMLGHLKLEVRCHFDPNTQKMLSEVEKMFTTKLLGNDTDSRGAASHLRYQEARIGDTESYFQTYAGIGKMSDELEEMFEKAFGPNWQFEGGERQEAAGKKPIMVEEAIIGTLIGADEKTGTNPMFTSHASIIQQGYYEWLRKNVDKMTDEDKESHALTVERIEIISDIVENLQSLRTRQEADPELKRGIKSQLDILGSRPELQASHLVKNILKIECDQIVQKMLADEDHKQALENLKEMFSGYYPDDGETVNRVFQEMAEVRIPEKMKEIMKTSSSVETELEFFMAKMNHIFGSGDRYYAKRLALPLFKQSYQELIDGAMAEITKIKGNKKIGSEERTTQATVCIEELNERLIRLSGLAMETEHVLPEIQTPKFDHAYATITAEYFREHKALWNPKVLAVAEAAGVAVPQPAKNLAAVAEPVKDLAAVDKLSEHLNQPPKSRAGNYPFASAIAVLGSGFRTGGRGRRSRSSKENNGPE